MIKKMMTSLGTVSVDPYKYFEYWYASDWIWNDDKELKAAQIDSFLRFRGFFHYPPFFSV